jgi:hypothetical protein
MYNPLEPQRLEAAAKRHDARREALARLREQAGLGRLDTIVIVTYRMACINGNWVQPDTLVYEGLKESTAAEKLQAGTVFAKHHDPGTARLLALEAAEHARKGTLRNYP